MGHPHPSGVPPPAAATVFPDPWRHWHFSKYGSSWVQPYRDRGNLHLSVGQSQLEVLGNQSCNDEGRDGERPESLFWELPEVQKHLGHVLGGDRVSLHGCYGQVGWETLFRVEVKCRHKKGPLNPILLK